MVESCTIDGSSGSSNPSEIKCMGCWEVVEYDHIGIKCPQAHDICSKCTGNFIDMVFTDPWSNLPPKCPTCSSEIPSAVFERQLTQDQLETYQLIILSKKLDKDDKLMSCPRCTYFEIWIKSSTSSLFYCKKADCQQVTCAYCKLQVKIPHIEDLRNLEEEFKGNERSLNIATRMFLGFNIDQDEFERDLNADKIGLFYHSKCAELYPYKQAIEEALENGEKRKCPECGLAGRKDNNCTHMICTVCQTQWCYFCGQIAIVQGEGIYIGIMIAGIHENADALCILLK